MSVIIISLICFSVSINKLSDVGFGYTANELLLTSINPKLLSLITTTLLSFVLKA
jgi:hypothetical protein